MNRRIRMAAIAFTTLAACSDSSGPTVRGALASSIVAGQNQVVVAGVKKLPSGVTEEIVRLAGSGKLQLRRPNAWERVFFPRLAWAQTVVKGSPVAGAIVCASEGDGTLIPFSRCANTDSKGQATFFFSTDTKAGAKKTLINGVVGSEATTFDTVKATVLADVFADSPLLHGTSWPGRTSPATFPPEVAVDKYGNAVPYGFVVVADAYGEKYDSLGRSSLIAGYRVYTHTQSDTLGTVGARTVVIDSVTGPSPGNGNDVVICGSVQVVTAAGVGATGIFRTSMPAIRIPALPFGLYAAANLSARSNCPS